MKHLLVNRISVVCFFAMISLSVQSHADGKGWHWGEEKERPVEATPTPTPPPQMQSNSSPAMPMTPREILKKQGEDWENAVAEAILNPTPENYQRYLAMTAAIGAQSQRFSTGVKETIWVNPEYDASLKRPHLPQAILAKNSKQNRLQKESLYEAAQDNGIIFFFRSDCPYCHRFAPIVKSFAETFGFSVIPVSLDGKGLPEYPYPKSNYDLGRKLNVTQVPALYMVNPEQNKVAVIGFGFNDWDKLIQKMLFAYDRILGSATIEAAHNGF